MRDYYYVGSIYGNNSEELMMQEIKKNGPIVSSFEPRHDFGLYSDGVYSPNDALLTISQGEINLPFSEWFKVDHSIVIYGWGVNGNGVRYWEALNSWGEQWGEKGHFRIRRGENALGIESMSTGADPVLIESGQKAHSAVLDGLSQDLF